MKKALYIFLALFCFVAVPMHAQKKGTKKTSKTTAKAKDKEPAVPTRSAEQLIQDYDFNAAARRLRSDIASAQKEGRSTERLEDDLRRAELGADMLRGTEQIAFVDSIKTDRAHVLSHLLLSDGNGKLTPTEEVATMLGLDAKELGAVGYTNDFGNQLFFAATDTASDARVLHTAYRQGNRWTAATPVEGLAEEDEEQDYPYLMPDGITLYFAAQGDESLGGYDLFVSRYNTDTKRFLRAENLGMPFNSPANDYLLVIDEVAQLGWLVTDRNQAPDTVCIYIFIPADTREVYEMSDANKEEVIHAAQIHSIAESQSDTEAVAAARERLAALKSAPSSTAGTKHRRYVIDDQTVYTSLTQFKSEAARRIAAQADDVADRLAADIAERDAFEQKRTREGSSSSDNQRLKELRTSIMEHTSKLYQLEKNYRKAEKGK